MSKESAENKQTRPGEITPALEELGRAARILALEGHNDISLGHVSMRDSLGRGIWMKRSHIGLQEVSEKDFLLVDFDGKVLEGEGSRHVEWPIHTEILRARPDINYVGHTHADYITMISCLKEELRPYSHAAIFLRTLPPPRFMETSELIMTKELGVRLATCLGQAESVLIRNHGCSFVGRTVPELCVTGVLLRRACQLHVTLAQTGRETLWPDDSEVERKRQTLRGAGLLEGYWRYYNRELERAERSR